MDFALLPPEVNSARMYTGAGAGPLLAAATAWDGLAAELHTVGLAYDSVLGELNSGWSGPSAAAMAAAAAPYAQWMHAAAARAEETAVAARAATAAYEAAFAMTVPPPVVAANRAQLLALIATNFLGQNTPAIAATEAHYAEMWAQDATAMCGYAGSAAAATRLTPFTAPPKTTSPTGLAGQASAVGRAVGLAAAETTGDGALTSITQVVPGFSAAGGEVLGGAALTGELATELAIAGGEIIIDLMGTFGIDVLGTFLIDAMGAAGVGQAALLAGMAASAAPLAPVAAGLSSAASIGALSVPLAWTVTASSAATPVGMSLAAVGAAAATASGVVAGETVLPAVGMAAAGIAGRAGASVGGRGPVRPKSLRQPAPPRHDNELPELAPATAFALLMGADIELRELAELRRAGILTDEEYAEQKQQLRSS